MQINDNRLPKTLVAGVLLILASLTIVFGQGENPTSITAIEWSPDNSQLAFGRVDGTVELIDAATRSLMTTLSGHSGIIMDIAWNADGTRLATGSTDQTIMLWNTADGTLISTLTGHTDWVTAVLWNADGTRLYSGSVEENPNLRVWDITTGNNILGQDTGSIADLIWNPDQSILTYVNPLGSIIFLDPQTLQPADVEFIRYPTKDVGIDVAVWSTDGQWIAAGGTNGSIAIWNAATGQQIAILGSKNDPVEYFGTAIRSLTFTPDNKSLLSLAADGTVVLWDINTGTRLASDQLSVTVRNARWQPNNPILALSEYLPETASGTNGARNTEETAQLQIFSLFSQLNLPESGS